MALIDNHQVKKIWLIVAKVWSAIFTAHKSLKDGKEYAAILRHLAKLSYSIRLDAHDSIWAEGLKIQAGLISQNISIGQK